MFVPGEPPRHLSQAAAEMFQDVLQPRGIKESDLVKELVAKRNPLIQPCESFARTTFPRTENILTDDASIYHLLLLLCASFAIFLDVHAQVDTAMLDIVGRMRMVRFMLQLWQQNDHNDDHDAIQSMRTVGKMWLNLDIWVLQRPRPWPCKTEIGMAAGFRR